MSTATAAATVVPGTPVYSPEIDALMSRNMVWRVSQASWASVPTSFFWLAFL